MIEGLSGKLDDLFTYLIVTCNDKNSISVDERVMHIKSLQATAVFLLNVRAVNVIISTLKSSNSVACSTVPVAIVPIMLNQEPVYLARRKMRFFKSLWSLNIPKGFL